MAGAAAAGRHVVTDSTGGGALRTDRLCRLSARALMLALFATATFSFNARPVAAKPARHVQAAQAPRPVPKSRGTAVAAPMRAKPLRLSAAIRARKVSRPTVLIRPRRLAPLRPLVVVDAGHGGRDSGAIGPSGTLEKTVVLATAQELGRQLRATGRYRVLFTRDRDVFVALSDRVRLAVSRGAALVISIHADASPDHRVRGASVYVRPAQSVGPDVVQAPAHRGAAPAIARALSEPTSILGSSRLQVAMINSLDDDLRMVPDPARQGRFHVLGAIGIPSVLVETGFISNRADEALLRARKHRATVAQALREAVDGFFARQAPGPASRT